MSKQKTAPAKPEPGREAMVLPHCFSTSYRQAPMAAIRPAMGAFSSSVFKLAGQTRFALPGGIIFLPQQGKLLLPARCKQALCFAKPQNTPLQKNMDAVAYANYLFGGSGGFSPGPGCGRGDNLLLSCGLCFYIASTSAFVSRAIISSSLVHTTSTFTRLPSPVMSLMSSPRSLFFSASIEMPRNSISLHTSLRT